MAAVPGDRSVSTIEADVRRRAALKRLAAAGTLPRADLAADEAWRTARERRRNRVLAALAWLLAAYPLSVGPAVYAVERGWVPPVTLTYSYFPIIGLAQVVRPAGEALEAYTRPFAEAGRRHAGR